MIFRHEVQYPQVAPEEPQREPQASLIYQRHTLTLCWGWSVCLQEDYGKQSVLLMVLV